MIATAPLEVTPETMLTMNDCYELKPPKNRRRQKVDC